MADENAGMNQDGYRIQLEQWMLAAMDLGTDIIELERAERLRYEAERIRDEENRRRFDEVRAKSGSIPWDMLETMNALEPLQDEQFLNMMRTNYKISLFLVALNKVARWSRKLVKVAPEFASPVSSYIVSFGIGKDLRDIMEHDDEYFTGGGKNPEKYVVKKPGIIANASGITIQGGEIFLGHQLSVQAMMKAIKTLHAEIVAPFHPHVSSL